MAGTSTSSTVVPVVQSLFFSETILLIVNLPGAQPSSPPVTLQNISLR